MSDFYSVLGLKPGASDREIREAYRKLVMTRHPDRFNDPAERAEAERIFMGVTEAYNVLSKASLRNDYDKVRTESKPATDPVKDSEKLVAAALARVKNNDLFGAIQTLEQAVALNPSNLRAAFELGWCKAKNPRWRQDGIARMEAAIKADAMNADYPCRLGDVYREAGMKERAKALYDLALGRDPVHAKALEGKALLDDKPQGGAGLLGFLKR